MLARLFCIASLLATPLAAAATHPRYLTLVPDGVDYVLAEDFTATEKAATFTLRAGTYTTLFEDKSGYYLLGAADCLEMRVVPPKQPENAYTMPFNCGVHLPKDEQEPARFFVIRAAIPHNSEYGVIVNAIIKAGEGGFNYPISAKYVVGLRERLSATPPAN
jgi:hypothetical protein